MGKHNIISHEMICSYCGESFAVKDAPARKRRNTSGYFFCSKFCQGKFVGREYGWGRKLNT